MNLLQTSLALVVGAVVAVATVACAQRESDAFSAAQVEQIQTVVHDYLVAHPEVLVEASQSLEKKQASDMESKATQAAVANAQELFAASTSPVIGNAKGTITLVEFFDYQCPHCVRMEPEIQTLIKNNANVRVVLKEFPIFGASSEYAARVSLAAYKQGRFAKFHENLMQVNKRLTEQLINQVAVKSGLNMKLLKSQLKSDAFNKEIKSNYHLAQALGLVGTPAFIVGYTDAAKDVSAQAIGFVPGQTDAAHLQSLIDKLNNSK